jgi:enoyl-CoA hydratase/carnithine racemase
VGHLVEADRYFPGGGVTAGESGLMENEAPLVRAAVAHGVATLTLDNPGGRNGWSRAMEEQYFDLLDQIDRSDDVRAVVVTGTGAMFCPGLDVTALKRASTASAGLDRANRRPMHYAIGLRKPMIAAINGGCAGLGLFQALCCDLRFAARGARLSTAFSRRGLSAEYGIGWLLARVMPMDRALDLLLSGRTVEADEALALGLVTRVYEPAELLEATTAYAADLAKWCSPRAMATMREQMHRDATRGFEDAVDDALDVMEWFNGPDNPDFAEGVASFTERRPPGFSPLPREFSVDGIRRAAGPRS